MYLDVVPSFQKNNSPKMSPPSTPSYTLPSITENHNPRPIYLNQHQRFQRYSYSLPNNQRTTNIRKLPPFSAPQRTYRLASFK